MKNQTVAERGFSLAEVLIGAVISVIALSVVIPSYRGPLPHTELKLEAARLKEEMEDLSIRAQSQNEAHRLTISKHGFTSSMDGHPSYMNYLFKNKVSAQIPSKKIIHFFPSGVTTPATVDIISEGASCQVILALRGQVTLKC